MASNREDLLDKLDSLHRNYRLCSEHFEQKMFANEVRNRLISDAVPTLFPTLEGTSRGSPIAAEHSYSRAYSPSQLISQPDTSKQLQSQDEPPKKICILGNVIVRPAGEYSVQPEPIETTQCLINTSEAGPSDCQSVKLLSPSSSTQTSAILSFNTPRKRKYREQMKKVIRENKKLATKLENRADSVHIKYEDLIANVSLEQYYALTHHFTKGSPELSNFINFQVSQCQKEKKGRRYTNDFKRESLAMYYAGPKMYKQILMKKFCMPSPQTLFRYISNLKIRPGLNNTELFNMLKMKMDGFQDLHKYCILSLDEMSIKANLCYNRVTDSMVGLAENEQGVKMLKPALHACVLMLRGLCARWKQPLAFYFCHSSCPAQSLKNIVTDAISKLKPLGVNICALTTDMGSNNLQLAQLLNVDPDHTSFVVDNNDIVYIFDIPHIIKAIRNMLLKYDFLIKGNIVSWRYIKMFYEHDKKYPVRAAPKLTDSHINPSGFEKMKVKFATQVFSATVSAGMNLYVRFGFLPAQAFATSEFVDRMDKLFDILNSSNTTATKKFNMAFKAETFQINFLQDCLDFFNTIEVRDKNNIIITNKIKSFKCLKISINSVLSLWYKLHDTANLKFLFTRRLNQDCLENFFGSIRQQNGTSSNPTALQFQRSFRKLLFLNLFHSGTENCEADIDGILLKLSKIPPLQDVATGVPETESTRVKGVFLRLDSDFHDILEKNFIRYVCGYLLKKGLEKHQCEICINYSKAHEELDDTSLYIYYKAYENARGDIFGNLQNPHDDFVKFITNLEIIFQGNFEEYIMEGDICTNFMNACNTLNYKHPCIQFPKTYVILLYIRVRLYYTVKDINRNFKNINKNKLIIWRHM